MRRHGLGAIRGRDLVTDALAFVHGAVERDQSEGWRPPAHGFQEIRVWVAGLRIQVSGLRVER